MGSRVMEEIDRAKHAYNQKMLTCLLVEFLRDIDLPFNIINNSKFRAVFQYACPSVTLPSHQELIDLNVHNLQLFKTWEKVTNSAIINDERRVWVSKWARLDMHRAIDSQDEKSKVSAEMHQVTPSKAPEASRDKTVWGLLGSEGQQQKEEMKPNVAELDKEIKVEEEEFVEYKPILEASSSDTCPAPYITDHEEDRGTKRGLITFEDAPGMLRWPCLVCLQRRDHSKLRDVRVQDACIMMYICVKSGQYKMDVAKELARMRRFNSCVHHLHDLYEQGLKILDIIDPNVDIHPENKKIVNAYYTINEIKNRRTKKNGPIDGSRIQILPFCKQFKNFFKTYGRCNYKACPGQPGYLDEKDMPEDEW